MNFQGHHNSDNQSPAGKAPVRVMATISRKLMVLFLLGFFLCGCSKPSFKETIWNFKEREGHSVEMVRGKEKKSYLVIRLDEEDYQSWLKAYKKGEEFDLELKARVK